MFVDNGRHGERIRGETVLRARADNVVKVRDVRDFDRFQARFADNRVLGLINGCPPGHSKVPGVCMPYGQAKKLVGTVVPTALKSSMLPVALRDYWQDNDDYYYRYNNDGYLYQVDRDTKL